MWADEDTAQLLRLRLKTFYNTDYFERVILPLLGISLLLGSASPYIVVILFAVLMELLFIRTEEMMLEEQFGQEWIQYRSRVRKWV